MKWINTSLALVVIVLAALLFKQCGKTRTAENLANAAADTLKTERNENGELESRILSYETSSERDFLKLKSADSTTLWLQNEVKKYKGKLTAALVASSSTSSQGTTATTVTDSDTITGQDGVQYIYETYSTDWSSKWEIGEIRASKDSIYRNIKVRNEFVFTIGEEKNGWFKRRETEIKMTNKNPNTVTKELRSYNLKQTPKRLGLTVFVGYGMNANGFGPQIGVGVGWQVIPIK